MINIYISSFFLIISKHLQIFLYMFSHTNIYTSLQNIPRDGSAGSWNMCSFKFTKLFGNAKLFSKVILPNHMLNCKTLVAPHSQQHLILLAF